MSKDSLALTQYWVARGAIVIGLGVAAIFWGDPTWPVMARVAVGIGAMALGVASITNSSHKMTDRRRQSWVLLLLAMVMMCAGFSKITLLANGRTQSGLAGWLYLVAGFGLLAYLLLRRTGDPGQP